MTSFLSDIMATVKVDHDYGTPGALRYQTLTAEPVVNANVRVWTKIDFDTGNTSAPIAMTLTDAQGNWVDPIFLEAGTTYVVQFHKPSVFGPDHVEIIV